MATKNLGNLTISSTVVTSDYVGCDGISVDNVNSKISADFSFFKSRFASLSSSNCLSGDLSVVENCNIYLGSKSTVNCD